MSDRRQLSEQSLSQQQDDYRAVQPERPALSDKIRIGRRVPETGQHEAISPDGSVASNGIKLFNASVQHGEFVRPTRAEGQPTVGLDRRSIPAPVAVSAEEELPEPKPVLQCAVLYEYFFPESDGGGNALYLAGDRDPLLVEYFYNFWQIVTPEDDPNWGAGAGGPGLGFLDARYGFWDVPPRWYAYQQHSINFNTFPDSRYVACNLTFEILEETDVTIDYGVFNVSGSGRIQVFAEIDTYQGSTYSYSRVSVIAPAQTAANNVVSRTIGPGKYNIQIAFAVNRENPVGTLNWTSQGLIYFSPNKIYNVNTRTYLAGDKTTMFVGRLDEIRTGRQGDSPFIGNNLTSAYWEWAYVAQIQGTTINDDYTQLPNAADGIEPIPFAGDWRRSLVTFKFKYPYYEPTIPGVIPDAPDYDPFSEPPDDPDSCYTAYRLNMGANIVVKKGKKTLYLVNLTEEQKTALRTANIVADVQVQGLLSGSSCLAKTAKTYPVTIQSLNASPSDTIRIIAVVAYPIN